MSQCLNFTNCIGIAAVSDYYDYVPDLIGNMAGLSNSTYRTVSILLPVFTTAGSYLLIWTKCQNQIEHELRHHRDRPERLYQMTWTKLFSILGPPVLIGQMWASIPYSKFSYPTSEYELMFDQMSALSNRCGSYPASHALSIINNQAADISNRFISVINQSLKSMPHLLGSTTLIFSIVMGLQIIICSCENGRFGRRDALMLAMQVAAFAVSMMQFKIASELDYGSYTNPNLDTCRAQYMTDAYYNTLPVKYGCD